ncbi:sporulation protein YhbH [Cellulosilyticum sp. I15G10I2]|uniref:sporulation protein YhbH n=1 Tax=Cellulosilyticum sp. I15G10I2 TaxID=1892843 RepID=UPI00085CA49E|nr:sporulation protein YhbH [Cellulosilyticum sp. I15G10I2]
MGTIFKEFQPNSRDRSVEDRRRHKELVEKSIKDNIGSIISEESIIGKSKNKKIKIPIKGLKEYYFKYGKNQKAVVAGSGEEEKGKKISKGDYGKGGSGDGAGNEEGEDIYETEITIEDAIHFLFEDLNLPYLQHKKFNEIETQYGSKRSGVRDKGSRCRLSKKHTVMEKIKRQKRQQHIIDTTYSNLKSKEILQEDRNPFHQEDLKYFYKKPKLKRDSNAVVLCIMDTSGSMGQTKKYLARSFYFLLYQFLIIKYIHVEIVFIAHTTVAKEVSENDFFHRGESGGTYISSGYQKALDIIEERYHPSNWNVYAFHCSDGDNWGEDNDKAVELANKLCGVCNLFGYGEIKTSTYTSTIMNRYYEDVNRPNFTTVKILKKEDVWTAFVDMLSVERSTSGGENQA